MARIRINLLALAEYRKENEKKAKFILVAKWAVFCFIFLVIGIGIFSTQVGFSSESIAENIRRFPFLSQIQRLARSAEKEVFGEREDRINILLLGIGGKGHEGGKLTDTIIVVSLRPSTGDVALFSLPRDLVLPVSGYGWRKINSLYALYDEQSPQDSVQKVAQTIGSVVLDAPIHYNMLVDFDGFSNIIDDLGGISVCVEHTFDDYAYPIRGQEDNSNYYARYEHLHVEEGCQQMDGSLALKYVRSRHASGAEGSDFARARRQQIVMKSIKDNVLSFSTLVNPKRVSDIYVNLRDHIITNIEMWEILHFIKLAREVDSAKIIHKVIDNSTQGFLRAAISEEGAYILEPRNGDFSFIQEFFKNIFSSEDSSFLQKKNQVRIEVQNGTTISGLANRMAEKLRELGYVVSGISNSRQQDFTKSVIYDFTGGTNSEIMEDLRQQFDANVSVILPLWLQTANQELGIKNVEKEKAVPFHRNGIDILLVVGSQADSL